MNWKDFENQMRDSLQSPPEPSQAEVDASWDRIEPKLFPDKKRGAGWFSLNAILALILVSLGLASMWLVPRAKQNRASNNVEIKSSTGDLNSTALDYYPQLIPSAAEDSDVTVGDMSQDPMADAPDADLTDPMTSDETVVANTTSSNDYNTAPTQSSGIASTQSSKTKSNKQNPSSTQKTTPKAKSQKQISYASATHEVQEDDLVASTENEPAAIQPKTSQKSQDKDAAKITPIFIPNHLDLISTTKYEILEQGDKKFFVSTVQIDSDQVHARVYKKELPELPEPNVKEVNNPIIETMEEITPPLAKDRSTLKDKQKSDSDPVKIAKPYSINLYTAGHTGIKANTNLAGGIFGLEWMQELNNKFNLILGLRYRLNSIKTDFTDKSLDFYDMTIDSMGQQTTVTMYYFERNRKYQASAMHIIEVPIYASYEVVRDFYLQLGLDVSVLLNTDYKLDDEWSTPKSSTQDYDASGPAPTLSADTDYAFDVGDTQGKFGIGMHLGAQYNFSRRMYARFAYSQLLGKYYSGIVKDPLGKYSSTPTLQLGLGINLSKKE